MGKINKRGFTLVELLATIAILGVLSVIAITAVNRYVRSAHDEHNEQSRKSVTMAAELYLQANRQLFPKQIGDETIIPISKLRDNNYLKEDVKNDEGESCMEKSFVRVYKLGKDDYSYTTYLYCGDDIVPDKIIPESPSVVNFEFHGVTKDNQFDTSAVKNADFTFTIYGGQTKNSKEIYSYQYAIMVNTGSGVREVYNSGSIKGNKQKSIDIKSKKLSSYVDIAGNSKVYVEVTVFNTEGGRLDYTSESVGGEGTGTFQDQTKPTCEYIAGQAADDNDWVNKTNLATQMASRRITVDCKDNENGSGCKRQKFSQTWPYNAMSPSGKVNYNFGARWSLVIISDNAKAVNETDCYARVNVDLQAPTITLTVYKAKADGSRGAKVLDSFTVQDNQTKAVKDMPTGTIPVDAYSDLVNTWMNDDKYPNGVIIDAEVTDNLYLYNYKWEVNEKDNSTTLSDESAEQDNGVEASGILTSTVYDDVKDRATLELAEKGVQNASIKGLRLYKEGKRRAKFTMCDKAGNCTTVVMKANIDRTHPICSTKIDYGTGANKNDYNLSSANLLTSYGWLGLVNGEGPKLEMARVTQVCYDPRNERSLCPNDMKSYVYDFELKTAVAGAEGVGQGGKIHDVAGNYSDCPADQTVQIDYTLPSCTTSLTFGSGTSKSSYSASSTDLRTKHGWLGLKNGRGSTKNMAKVTQVCADSGSPAGVNSTCDPNSIEYFIYDQEIETSQAGPKGDKIGGYVLDKAANKSPECPTNKTVWIDYTAPLCDTGQDYATGASKASYPTSIPTSNTDGSGLLHNAWLSLKGGTGSHLEMTRVYQTCTDPNGYTHSGCDDESLSSYVYDFEIKTDQAGAAGDKNGGDVYDKAGNLSASCPTNKHVWIDYTKAVCTADVSYGVGANKNNFTPTSDGILTAHGWLGWQNGLKSSGIKEMAKVTQVCNDNQSPRGINSDCDDGSINYFIYDYEIETDNAGAMGYNDGGTINDIAGNISSCPKKTVKIDYTLPTCTTITKYAYGSSSTNFNDSSTKLATSYGWIGLHDGTGPLKNMAKVTQQCTENGTIKSGCDDNSIDYFIYDSEMDISNAGAMGRGVGGTVYDKAGNISAECDPNQTVRIDYTIPVCGAGQNYGTGTGASSYSVQNTTGSGYLNGTDNWLSLKNGTGGSSGNEKEMTRIYQTCSDPNGTTHSTCDPNSINYHTYDYEIKTDDAGAAGDGQGGTVADQAGNISATCPTGFHVWTDYTKPACNLSRTYASNGKSYDSSNNSTVDKYTNNPYSGEWTTATVRVSRECKDEAGTINSDCTTTSKQDKHYDYPGAANTHYSKNLGPGGDGTTVTVDDVAGNIQTCGTLSVNIDRKKPDCSVSAKAGGSSYSSGTWTNQTVTVSRSCSDTGGSGCTNASNDSKPNDYEGTNNGNYTTSNAVPADTSIVDNVGNSNTCSPITVKIDRHAPECKLAAKYPNNTDYPTTAPWTNQTITVSSSCDDGTGGSGCVTSAASHPYTDTQINTTTAGAKGENNAGSVSDGAGNTTDCGYRSIKIDKKAPTGECTLSGSYNTNSSNSMSITPSRVSDNSGVGGVSQTYKFTGESSFTSSSSRSNSLSCSSSGTKTGYMYLTDSLGNNTTITCTGSVSVPTCCGSGSVNYGSWGSCSEPCDGGTKYRSKTSKYDGSDCGLDSASCNSQVCCASGHIKYKDGSSCSVSCGSGTYNRLAYSSYYSDYSHRCSSFDTSTGGSNCSITCTTKVYLCQANVTHGTSNWYDSYAWTYIRQGNSFRDVWYDTPGINGMLAGFKTPIEISGERTLSGTTYTVGTLSSCGNIPGTNTSSLVAGYCNGWVYNECYKTSVPTSDCGKCEN